MLMNLSLNDTTISARTPFQTWRYFVYHKTKEREKVHINEWVQHNVIVKFFVELPEHDLTKERAQMVQLMQKAFPKYGSIESKLHPSNGNPNNIRQKIKSHL